MDIFLVLLEYAREDIKKIYGPWFQSIQATEAQINDFLEFLELNVSDSGNVDTQTIIRIIKALKSDPQLAKTVVLGGNYSTINFINKLKYLDIIKKNKWQSKLSPEENTFLNSFYSMNNINDIKNYTVRLEKIYKKLVKKKEQSETPVEYRDNTVTIFRLERFKRDVLTVGKNTKWCINTVTSDPFKSYLDWAQLYVFVPTNPSRPREKYLLAIAKNEEIYRKKVKDLKEKLKKIENLLPSLDDHIKQFDMSAFTKRATKVIKDHDNKYFNKILKPGAVLIDEFLSFVQNTTPTLNMLDDPYFWRVLSDTYRDNRLYSPLSKYLIHEMGLINPFILYNIEKNSSKFAKLTDLFTKKYSSFISKVSRYKDILEREYAELSNFLPEEYVKLYEDRFFKSLATGKKAGIVVVLNHVIQSEFADELDVHLPIHSIPIVFNNLNKIKTNKTLPLAFELANEITPKRVNMLKTFRRKINKFRTNLSNTTKTIIDEYIKNIDKTILEKYKTFKEDFQDINEESYYKTYDFLTANIAKINHKVLKIIQENPKLAAFSAKENVIFNTSRGYDIVYSIVGPFMDWDSNLLDLKDYYKNFDKGIVPDNAKFFETRSPESAVYIILMYAYISAVLKYNNTK